MHLYRRGYGLLEVGGAMAADWWLRGWEENGGKGEEGGSGSLGRSGSFFFLF